MALFIANNPLTLLVAQHLYEITGRDGFLGQDPFSDPSMYKVSYSIDAVKGPILVPESPSDALDFLRSRIKAIVDSTIKVVIFGGDPATTEPKGFTLCKLTGGTYGLAPGVFGVSYEVSECLGKGYWVVGESGAHIKSPSAGILWHELCHVYHVIIGDTLANSHDEQVRAIVEENVFREYNSLPPRNPSIDTTGGCEDCGKGSIGWKPDGSVGGLCFMISAAYQSQSAPEVLQFQHVRENWLGRSRIGYEFYRRLYKEYVCFAPFVAERMSDFPQLRIAVRLFLVEPLLVYFQWLDSHIAYYNSTDPNRREVLLRLMLRHRRNIHEQGVTDQEIMEAGTILEKVPELLLDGRHFAPDPYPHTRSRMHQVLQPALRYIATEAQRGAKPYYLGWTIAEPLAAYWRLMGAWTSHKANLDNIAVELQAFSMRWVAKIPLGPLFRRLDREKAKTELQELSSTFLRPKHLRLNLGMRLLREFETSVSYDLKDLLVELDFLKENQIENVREVDPPLSS